MKLILEKWKKHLEDNNMTYWQHWKFAMFCSVALFIHAWLPCFLQDYASKKLLNNHIEGED